MKRNAMAVETKPPFTSVKRDTENFPRNENITLQLACEEALYFGGVARRDESARGGVRGAFARHKWRTY